MNLFDRYPMPKALERTTQRGLSLVELLVAMAIGLVLLTVLATIFANSSRSQQELTLQAQQVENGRYAIEILADELNHAGYYGYYSTLATPAAGMPDPCSTTAADIRAALTLPVQGYNSPATSPISCIDNDNLLPNTDILVVRRVATTVTASGSLVAAKIYMQSNTTTTDAANPIVALGNGTFSLTVRNGSGAYVAAPIREMKTHIYFVAPCSTPTGSSGTKCTSTDDGGSPIPTLKRLELTNSGSTTTFVTYPLVEGVQNLQVEYGVDSDGDGSPNATYTSDPLTTAAWQNVMAVRVYVLARNTRQSPGYTDTKTYKLGDTTVTGSGSYRRHVYDTTVRVKNASERRETP